MNTTQTSPTTNVSNVTLIVGGTGKTGRRVAEQLTARGIPVRLASRSASPRFDWEDEGTWGPVLEGVESMYITYYPDLAVPGAAENIRRLATRAVQSGVRRIVLLSGRGEHQVLPAERAVRESGAAFTILRASWFAQNFSEGHLLDPILQGELAFPAGDIAEPFIDVEDIADVAVAALTDAKHAGKIYELSGPRLLTFAEAVAEISEASGRPVRYVPISTEEYGAAIAPYVPADYAAFLVDLFSQILDGHNAYLSNGVQLALGREPRDFRDYARAAAASGAWGAATT
ncbi:NAD(P)H-binding protein [Pendulispora albinea]|uniref:NAD(P)H-binding protein n=1 Tax=Pendulispora albinea TaxID=2741071 RepID=A0ABZ2LVW1_9BACT